MAELKPRKYGATYERIREWLLYDGPEERPSAPKLWEEDKVVYERLVQLRALYFQKALTYHDALKVMAKQYGLSEATFMRDHNGLIYVFGDLQLESKEFDKIRLREIQFKILQQCLANGDMKSANQAMGNLIKLGGHDRDEGEKIPLELLNPGAYALVLDEAGQKFANMLLNSGPVVNLTDLMAQDAQDIDYEDMDEPKEAEKE
jgi:hypothetical protein